MTELKRCPECGGVATVIHMYDTYDKGTVVYVHSKGRYIVAECGGVRETFFPEDIVPGQPPMVCELKDALFTLTEVDKKIMTALGRRC
jgi:hypothetical protein